MKKLIIVVMMCLTACGSDEANTIRTLKASGYYNITITGWAPFECGKDDTFSTGFSAKNPAGQTVSGVVCCGLMFKGCTVRF